SGHEVVRLSRNPTANGRRFDALRGEPPDLSGCDAVVHLAGEPVARRWTPAHKERVRVSRERGTAAVVRAALDAGGVKRLVSASAVGYYGARGDEPLGEDEPPGDDFLARVCVAWEAATAPLEAAGIRTVRLRIGQVLHPEGGMLKQVLPPFRLGLGTRLGTGAQGLSWIHREDLIALVLFALDHSSLSGPVNATAPEPVSNAEFTRALSAALHRPAAFTAPAFALRLALGEMAEVLLSGNRAVPRRALAEGFAFRFPSLKAALADFF
ncbi:MAG TPA: TIGR01777 family oxidoreductase, partial [Myxococcaceae bacterium]|nr:TIGR01777 family oxidoreductase [Myxococcaceae bacterium]